MGRVRDCEAEKDEIRSDDRRKRPISRSKTCGDLKAFFNVTRRKFTRPGCPLVSENKSREIAGLMNTDRE